MALKLGEPIELTLSKRYYQFNRGYAIRDVFDALVELITNSDDSYHRMYQRGLIPEDGGKILIEHCEQRKTQPSILRVHDRAEGMTLEEMREKLADVGTKRSEKGDRGFMSRGLKDCTALGNVAVESIKDDRYYKCQLTTHPQFIPLANQKVTAEIRQQMRIPHRNGTVVSLELNAEHRMPRFDTLARDLPWHYALRDIMSLNSAAEVKLRRELHREEKPEHLTCPNLEGELVLDELIQVPGYPGATANLRIWRAGKPFNDDRERFREYGILIKAERAIHQCNLLLPEFERDPNGRRYFGRLECPFIDRILNEYDECLQRGSHLPESNPRLLIDPNRQTGLDPSHPFTVALFQIPAERLRALLAKDRDAQEPKDREISSEETRSRLDRLGKAASKFLQEQLEDTEELTAADGDHGAEDSINKLGLVLYPPFVRVAIGEDRTLTCYANRNLVGHDEATLRIDIDEPSALSALASEIVLRPHSSKEQLLMGTFRVRGNAVRDAVIISAHGTNLPKAESIAEVVETMNEDHEFVELLEFERKKYRVQIGRQKTLWLYAKYPDIVSAETEAEVITSNGNSLPIRGRCRLVPIAGTNFARGEVVVQGRRLTQRDVSVQAKVHGRVAETMVRVIPEMEVGIQIKIELRDEDYGNFRAKWADDENRPHVLLISARHESLKRYLGPAPDFDGQSTAHFRILLAEIVAESVSRKSLGLEAKERPWEFRWADLGKDHIIADTILAALHKRMRQFVAEAHAIMLGDRELRKISLSAEKG